MHYQLNWQQLRSIISDEVQAQNTPLNVHLMRMMIVLVVLQMNILHIYLQSFMEIGVEQTI